MATVGRVFLDTNVFVYTSDGRDRAKQRRAGEVIASAGSRGVVSTQVMQELYSALTRKLGVAPAAARESVHSLLALEVVTMPPAVVLEAVDIAIAHRLSIWDALLIATAASAGCATLLTEDLQPGQVLRGVRIEDPFA